MTKGLMWPVLCAVVVAPACWGDERLDVRRDAVVRAIERAAPAVVNISTDKIIDREFLLGWDFFGPRVAHSLGSGGIFTADGFTFTNAHVVNQASRIMVTLRDGARYPADLVKVDTTSDLAVIKINADRKLPTLALGRSDDLMVGEKAVAVGNPFGLENSVTTGVISAVARDIEVEGRVLFEGVVQTDVLINPGNSGGPLLNVFGEVIGVNSAIRAGAQGIGFAVPIDRVKDSLAALLDYRKSRRISFGFELAPRYVSSGPETSLAVKNVVADGPAARAGIRVGDVIVAVGELPSLSLAHFRAGILASAQDKVPLTLERGGRRLRVEVEPAAIPKPDAAGLAAAMLGLSVQQMEASLAGNVGIDIDHGILVAGVARNSSAWHSGLRFGDVINQVNHTHIRTMDEFGLALEAAENDRSLYLVVLRVEGFFLLRFQARLEIQRPR